MASFTPVDVVRLAPVSRRRVPDEDLHPVVNTLTIRLASAEPMLRADLPMSISDVNLRCQSRPPLLHRVHDGRGLRGPLAFPGGAL